LFHEECKAVLTSHIEAESTGVTSPFHSSSERTDVKPIESGRNLSAKAWFRQLYWQARKSGLGRMGIL